MSAAAVVAGLAAGLLGVAALPASAPVAAPASAPTAVCSALQVQHDRPGALSTVVAFELPGGTARTVGRLGYHVNALGSANGLAYGIATRDHDGPLRPAHVVTIDQAGRVTDLGPVDASRNLLSGAAAGAAYGSRLYVREQHRLYTLDIDQGSPTFLDIVGEVRLSPASGAFTVNDFAPDPDTGLLYGVSTAWWHEPRVVSIDPRTGEVRTVSVATGLPGGPSYTSVVLGDDGVLYAVNPRIGRHSELYAVTLDGSAPARRLASLPTVAGSDAAGCFGTAPAPAPPPPPPTPPPPAEPAPTTTVTPEPPAPAPTTEPAEPEPPAASLPVVQQPPPPPPQRSRVALPRPQAEVAEQADDPTKTKRQWGLAVLLLVLGAGAVSARMAR